MTEDSLQTSKGPLSSIDHAQEFYLLRLYVARHIDISLAAIANLRQVSEEHLTGRCEIELIDLLQTPRLAAATRSWLFAPSCACCRRR